MLWAGKVVEGLMALSVTVEDKEWVIGIPGDGMDIAGSERRVRASASGDH